MDAIPNGVAINGHSASDLATPSRTSSGVHILAGPSQPPSNLASCSSSLHESEIADYDSELRPIPKSILDTLPTESRQVLTTFEGCPRPKVAE